MSTPSLEHITRRFFESFDTRDLDALTAAVSHDFVFHRPTRRDSTPDGTTEIRGREGFAKFLRRRYPAPASRHIIDNYCETGEVTFVSGTIEYPAESLRFEWVGRTGFDEKLKIASLHVSLFPIDTEQKSEEVS